MTMRERTSGLFAYARAAFSWYALLIAGCGVALVMGVVFYGTRTEPQDCPKQENARWCLIRETERIAKSDGVTAAFAYVRDVVNPNTTYATVHLAQHYVGYEAYRDTGSVSAALALLPANGFDPENFDLSAGFRHGVFERYFEENSRTSVQELAADVCEDYEAESLDALTYTERRQKSECYHAVGHATMYIRDNDIDRSIAECEQFGRGWMQHACYFGAFMENTYLLYEEYRSDVERSTIEQLTPQRCMDFEHGQRSVCAVFVGWSYMLVHHDDYVGAFSECAQFDESDAEACVARVGRVFVAKKSDDFQGKRATCALAGTYAESCLEGTAIGLSYDDETKDNANQGVLFCQELQGATRQSCEDELQYDAGYRPEA